MSLTKDELQRVQYVLREAAASSTNAMVHDDLNGLADKLEAEPELDTGLRERVADMLAENDAAGPGPVSRDEYLADAAAILVLVGHHEVEAVRERDEAREALHNLVVALAYYRSGPGGLPPSIEAACERAIATLDSSRGASVDVGESESQR